VRPRRGIHWSCCAASRQADLAGRRTAIHRQRASADYHQQRVRAARRPRSTKAWMLGCCGRNPLYHELRTSPRFIRRRAVIPVSPQLFSNPHPFSWFMSLSAGTPVRGRTLAAVFWGMRAAAGSTSSHRMHSEPEVNRRRPIPRQRLAYCANAHATGAVFEVRRLPRILPIGDQVSVTHVFNLEYTHSTPDLNAFLYEGHRVLRAGGWLTRRLPWNKISGI